MPVVKSCAAFLKLPVIIHSTAEPITYRPAQPIKYAAAKFFYMSCYNGGNAASKQDFINMAGNTNAGGIPKSRLFYKW